jgi:hypothetical protein
MTMEPTSVIDRLKFGKRLAAEVVALSESRRAWIGIHPFKVSYLEEYPDVADQLPWRFQVRVIEVDKSFDYDKLDLHPEYIYTRYDMTIESIQQVKEKLAEFGVDFEQLCDPSECHYPL